MEPLVDESCRLRFLAVTSGVPSLRCPSSGRTRSRGWRTVSRPCCPPAAGLGCAPRRPWPSRRHSARGGRPGGNRPSSVRAGTAGSPASSSAWSASRASTRQSVLSSSCAAQVALLGLRRRAVTSQPPSAQRRQDQMLVAPVGISLLAPQRHDPQPAAEHARRRRCRGPGRGPGRQTASVSARSAIQLYLPAARRWWLPAAGRRPRPETVRSFAWRRLSSMWSTRRSDAWPRATTTRRQMVRWEETLRREFLDDQLRT